MRTLIVSDLHLGSGGPYDAFAGEDALPDLLDREGRASTHVIVNGDGVDFLMNDDPLVLDPKRAVDQARAIAEGRASRRVFEAMGRALARGCEVTLRLGNHDVELALPEVQTTLRAALGQPPSVAARLRFQHGDAPAILSVGGARILVTHGEHNDPWNRVDYADLARGEGYTYAPGSRLVKELLNPIARDDGLRFLNLLKPDFQGGLLTGLAVAPWIVKHALKRASWDVVWHLLKKTRGPASFAEGEGDYGISSRIDAAGLTIEERAALEADMGDGPLAFAGEDDEGLSRKLARAGLAACAAAQRRIAGREGDAYFDLAPSDDEARESARLAAKYDVSAVITGHTHAARWGLSRDVVTVNTGTWIHLMQLPPYDAGDDAWTELLAELRHDPGLSSADARWARTMTRFTAAIAAPCGEGALVSLVAYEHDGPSTLGEALIPAR